MNCWETVRISDLQASTRNALVGGPFGSDLVSRDYVEEGVPVIRGTNLPFSSMFSFDDFVFVSEKKADELRHNNAHPNDLIFTQRGTLGQVGLIPLSSPFPRFVISQSQMKLTVDLTKANGRFLYFYFRLRSTVEMILNLAISSGVPHINLETLRRFEVPLPPLAIQKKIAAILTAYDDLIENNQRRIAALEKMAEELYREWFVRLRFPGHEKVKLVKGVPEGWDVLPFTAVANINPTERLPKDEEVPYVGMDELSTSSMYFVSHERRKNGSGSKFRNRDVLVPRITPCLENGKRGFTMTLAEGELAVGSTEFIVVREKLFSAEHLYLMTCSNSFRQHAELSMTGASGRQRVQEDCFSFFWVPIPPEPIRERFTALVKPMFQMVNQLSLQNDSLRQTRDLLLPRLISGKLRVDALDIQFPPSISENSEAGPPAGLPKQGRSKT